MLFDPTLLLVPRLAIETKSASDTAGQPAATPRPVSSRYRPRRTTGDRVREALLALTGGRASLLAHEEKAWNSITFSGTRHEVMLDFDGADAVAVGEDFIASLPDHEFQIPSQLVADATIREVDHTFGADERMVVTAVLLLLEES